MMDDRVCMHYVVDRLEELIEIANIDKRTVDPEKVYNRLCDFKDECIYNLGVNTRIKHKGEN